MSTTVAHYFGDDNEGLVNFPTVTVCPRYFFMFDLRSVCPGQSRVAKLGDIWDEGNCDPREYSVA